MIANTRRAGALIAIVGLLAGASAAAGENPRVLLEADFDNQPIDDPIGTSGPAFGEPVSVDAQLSAIVRASPLSTPSLELSHALPDFSRSARFEFLDSEEISHGDLIMQLTVHVPQLDYFNINVREAATNTQVFLQLIFTAQGNIAVNDANGFAGNLANYSLNVDHRLRLEYHMDRGTYDVELDGVAILVERSHGTTGNRGIGALIVGTSSQTVPGNRVYIDNIRVVRGDGVFGDGFE